MSTRVESSRERKSRFPQRFSSLVKIVVYVLKICSRVVCMLRDSDNVRLHSVPRTVQFFKNVTSFLTHTVAVFHGVGL